MADAEWTVPTGDPVEAMKYALESIRQYGLDTLSGRTDGPADVKWHRDGVNEMTKRARLGLEAAAAAPQPAASDVPHDVGRALGEVDWNDLNEMFKGIPAGPYQTVNSGSWEVRQVDTDPTNNHHWPFRLCQSIAGQTAACHSDVFSFIAGVLNAWPSIAALATPVPSNWTEEALRAENARLRGVLEPFARVAEHDIGTDEADDDLFRPFHSLNRAPRLTVGHLREALSALSR